MLQQPRPAQPRGGALFWGALPARGARRLWGRASVRGPGGGGQRRLRRRGARGRGPRGAWQQGPEAVLQPLRGRGARSREKQRGVGVAATGAGEDAGGGRGLHGACWAALSRRADSLYELRAWPGAGAGGSGAGASGQQGAGAVRGAGAREEAPGAGRGAGSSRTRPRAQAQPGAPKGSGQHGAGAPQAGAPGAWGAPAGAAGWALGGRWFGPGRGAARRNGMPRRRRAQGGMCWCVPQRGAGLEAKGSADGFEGVRVRWLAGPGWVGGLGQLQPARLGGPRPPEAGQRGGVRRGGAPPRPHLG
jgi:hypothetical protein